MWTISKAAQPAQGWRIRDVHIQILLSLTDPRAKGGPQCEQMALFSGPS